MGDGDAGDEDVLMKVTLEELQAEDLMELPAEMVDMELPAEMVETPEDTKIEATNLAELLMVHGSTLRVRVRRSSSSTRHQGSRLPPRSYCQSYV